MTYIGKVARKHKSRQMLMTVNVILCILQCFPPWGGMLHEAHELVLRHIL